MIFLYVFLFVLQVLGLSSPPTTTTVVAPTTTTPAIVSPPPPTTNNDAYAAWTKISICENGLPGWNPPKGSKFPDSIGFTAANWEQFGGGSDLSPATQIAVGQRFMAHYGMALPDQNGCGGGY